MTVEEFARETKRSLSTIYKLIANGKLKYKEERDGGRVIKTISPDEVKGFRIN